MDDDPAYTRTISLHVSRNLDDIGLNTKAVKLQRKTYLLRESINTLPFHLKGVNASVYHFGSQTEGTTTPGLNSDVDTLICNDDIRVIQDWPEWKHCSRILMMRHEDTAPGYCRLQLLRTDMPMKEEVLLNHHLIHDSSGNVIWKNTSLNMPETGLPIRNGPARSVYGAYRSFDRDYVLAVKCMSWPVQADGFIRRERQHGWPSMELIEEATKHGVFLVPVGYKLSQTENIEWRLSASLAERCLMFSLTIVHIKCYVLLKMLVKTFIEPRIKRTITSYHCKTAVLHLMENQGPGPWRDDNLLYCVNQCLVLLHKWVADGFCPQFILPEENLFAGKVTLRNKGLLQSILTDLISSNGRIFLRLQCDDFGRRLETRLATSPSSISILDSDATKGLAVSLEINRTALINNYERDILMKDNNKDTLLTIQSIQDCLRILKMRFVLADKYERHAIQIYTKFLHCWLGSIMAADSLSHNKVIPRKSIRMIRAAAKFDVASMLKLASVYYCKGDFDKVEKLLQGTDISKINANSVSVCSCSCETKYSAITGELIEKICAMKWKKVRRKLIARCVSFSPSEIHCAPPALRNELQRVVGDDIQYRDPRKDKWMVLAVVGCLPFLYYLQYLTYKQTGKDEMRKRSLMNLVKCEGHGHDETVWNMLGQCLEIEGDMDAAMNCYRMSLKIRPVINAANWLVQNMPCVNY